MSDRKEFEDWFFSPSNSMSMSDEDVAWEAWQARAQVQGELEPYDAGLLNDFGGGNVEWWQDYIRAELGRAHDFYQSQLAPPQAAQATLTLRPERVPMIARSLAEWHEDDGYAVWWAWNGDLRGWAGEPAYIGSPLCDDWPGYHTHWTAHPTQPIGITAQAKKEGA